MEFDLLVGFVSLADHGGRAITLLKTNWRNTVNLASVYSAAKISHHVYKYKLFFWKGFQTVLIGSLCLTTDTTAS